MHHWSKLKVYALVNMEIIHLLNALYDTYKILNIIHIHAKLFYHLLPWFPSLTYSCHTTKLFSWLITTDFSYIINWLADIIFCLKIATKGFSLQ